MNPEESSLLHNAITRAIQKSPFWHDRLSKFGIGDRHLVHDFPFDEIPPVTKGDLIEDQASHPPFGRLLAVAPEDVRRVHRTSGTSATPLFVALTERDIADTYVSAERAFKLAGMAPGDRVVHCFNFNMWSGGISDYIPIERLRATAIPFGVGNTSLLIRLIRTLGVNAISSTPSYMFALRDRCHSEFQLDPRELGLRRGYFGGEALLQLPGVRNSIETDFGMVAMDANYGMSEIQSVIGGEGPERNGLENHTHGILFTELIGTDGKTVPIETGAIGELVFSTLRREAQPLFRYRSNDLAEIAHAKVGEDGLVRMRFVIRGRTDQMLVFKGVNFFPQSLMSIVAEFPEELGSAYRVIRPAPGFVDYIEVVMESAASADGWTSLSERIERRISALLQIRTRIRFVPIGALHDEGANKSRFIAENLSDIVRPERPAG